MSDQEYDELPPGDNEQQQDDANEQLAEVESKQAKAEAMKRQLEQRHSAQPSQESEQAPSSSRPDSNVQGGDGYDLEAQKEIDSRSIYVGNVDYSVTSGQLAQFFQTCGTVQKVTIPGDQHDHPKGYAYVEFVEHEAVKNALLLTGQEVGGRPVKISQKRTNIAGFNRGRGRGRGGRGRGRGVFADPTQMAMMMPGMLQAMFTGSFPGSGRGGRGRGRGRRGGAGYAPY